MDLGRKAEANRKHAAAREEQAHKLDSRLAGPPVQNPELVPDAVQPGYPEGRQRAHKPPVDLRGHTAPPRGVAPVRDQVEQHPESVLSGQNRRVNTGEVHTDEEVPRDRQQLHPES